MLLKPGGSLPKLSKAAVDKDQELVLFKYCLFETKYTRLISDWNYDGIVCNKIIELTENKEAALRERIPKKTGMSLRTTLRDIKEEETENFNEAFFQPPILFVPEESHIFGMKRNLCCL